jgi:hypothetical protein
MRVAVHWEEETDFCRKRLLGGKCSAVDFAQKIAPLNVIKLKYGEEPNFKLFLAMSSVTAFN